MSSRKRAFLLFSIISVLLIGGQASQARPKAKASALATLGVGATEFVVATMDNSLAALVGMLLVGGIVTTLGIRSSSSNTH